MARDSRFIKSIVTTSRENRPKLPWEDKRRACQTPTPLPPFQVIVMVQPAA